MGRERIVGVVLLALIFVFCIVHLALAPSQKPHRWVFIMLFIGFVLFTAFAKKD